MKRFIALIVMLVVGITFGVATDATSSKLKGTPAPSATKTSTQAPSSTQTPTAGPSATNTPEPLPSPTLGAVIEPFWEAPLCTNHNPELPHGLWDWTLGCHYDHEHGADAFSPSSQARFPGLLDFMCQHPLTGCNSSGPTENTVKHGGFKWQVQETIPHAGELGFEDAEVGICGDAIRFHNFGDNNLEATARFHSVVAYILQCLPDDLNDLGHVKISQILDFGQFVVPYQGLPLDFPGAPAPYDSRKAPYNTADCSGDYPQCRISVDWLRNRVPFTNNASTWTSNCFYAEPCGTRLFGMLFRSKDNYQLLNYDDQDYPYTMEWVCSLDHGATFTAIFGCAYNNSTAFVSEIRGVIPDEWDNLAGFDTNPEVGRITATGHVTRYGDLAPACIPGGECYLVELTNAFTGHYGGFLGTDKTVQFGTALPERDICFNPAHVWVPCTDAGAMASGWIGPSN